MTEPYNPIPQSQDFYIPAEVWDELPDLDYFRKKAERASSPEAAAKYRKQLELLEDAVVIYRLGAPRILHSKFLSEQVRVRDFLKKLLDW